MTVTQEQLNNITDSMKNKRFIRHQLLQQKIELLNQLHLINKRITQIEQELSDLANLPAKIDKEQD